MSESCKEADNNTKIKKTNIIELIVSFFYILPNHSGIKNYHINLLNFKISIK